ncbi:MAG: hypothetical protein A2X84_13965 [Desulfuromonadaceae bacterium GWC2_58_13]|nr:MAG: hypothetical protein A2X84_13965 [Desulfuromonadaceae bacterium GWC2_58_13]
MRFPAFRQFFCLLLLAAAPFAGLWLGEGMVSLVSVPAAIGLLILSFGAALLSPSPRPREKYYVLLAATVMFVGAWAAGQSLAKRALVDCMEQGGEVQAALEGFRAEHGAYPRQLEQLDIKLPGRLHLHAPLLHYQPEGDGYRLYFSVDNVRFVATRYTPFVAHRQED